MNMIVTEQRPLYGIGTVARLSGIKPDTLRVWERRYGLGASHKSDNGRRLYTQTDLEHLQIISRLVKQGFRIGEIASMERKTLAAILDQGVAKQSCPTPCPRAIFVGEGLCSWLDRHPGCLSGLDSNLLRYPLEWASSQPQLDLGDLQILVVEARTLNVPETEALLSLRDQLGAQACAVFFEFASRQTIERLSQQGIVCARQPLATDIFASTVKRLAGSLETGRGTRDAGELAALQPRLFSDTQLVKFANMPSMLECGCSGHLTGIIQSLLHFEQYSSQCSVESWTDAATHTCIYTYTNQARWLMEKALTAVLEEHAAHTDKPVA